MILAARMLYGVFNPCPPHYLSLLAAVDQLSGEIFLEL